MGCMMPMAGLMVTSSADFSSAFPSSDPVHIVSISGSISLLYTQYALDVAEEASVNCPFIPSFKCNGESLTEKEAEYSYSQINFLVLIKEKR